MFALASPCLAALALAPFAGDPPEWGGFRGTDGAGVSAQSSIPESFDPDGNLLWSAPVPAGYSSPVVAGERLFLTGVDGKRLVTLCLDAVTGEERWSAGVDFDGSRIGQNSPAACTPATDGRHVFVLFHHLGMRAYDLEGKEVWHNDLGAPFDIPHGLATSPVLHGDTVVVQIDQDGGSRLVALDKATGKERWSVERPGVTHGYATPVIHVPAEGPAQVIVSASFQTAGYSLEDGEKLWWVDGAAWQTKCVPVLHGDLCIVNAFMVPSSEFGMPSTSQSWEEVLAARDGDGDELISQSEWNDQGLRMAWAIFDLDDDGKLNADDYRYLQAMGTATGGLFAIRLGGRGDVTDSHVVWKIDDSRGLSDVISPVLVGGTLFVLKDGGILTAIDAATGKVGKRERIADPDRYFASPVAAGDRVLTTSLGGLLSVVKAGEEWEVLSTADIDEEVWSTPALARGLVFVRSQEAVHCFFAEEG